MQRSTETHHVLMFDVSECADTWINDHFFPASGAPRLGTHRRMVSRDAYFHRFYHFVGRTPKGHRLDRRATMNASADYAIAEVSAAPDSVVATSDLSFAVRAGRAPFRIDALDPMAVSVV